MRLSKLVSGCIVFFTFTGLVLAQTVTFYQTGEEFVGPFPSWKNIKTDYQAVGDGSTNDAAAITRGLQALAKVSNNNFNVLYFPAGTYLINSTVFNTSALGTKRATGDDFSGVSLVGEDPANTVIKWGGTTGGDMMVFDGWYIKIARITFDGQSKAANGLIRWGSFATSSVMSDLVFKDITGNGITNGPVVSGTGSDGQAEQLYLRCKFINCGTGILNPNQNSLDHWPVYCLFQDCGTGITNGGFQSYCNVFLRSKTCDIGKSGQPICVVNNTSVSSANFSQGEYQMFYQQNKIYNPAAALQVVIFEGVCLDNDILGRNITVRTNQGCQMGALVAGTNSSVNPAVSITVPNDTKTTLFDNNTVSASTIAVPGTIELPGTPPKVVRKIFEVTNPDNFQSTVLSACAEPAGSKPVIHFAKGGYSLRTMVVIPGNKEFSIVGDGPNYGSSISNGNGTAIKLLAPSRVTISDIGISGNPGLLIEVNDTAGSRILGYKCNFTGPNPDNRCSMSVLVDSVENSNLTFFGTEIARFNHGVLVKGGPDLASGKTTPGQVAFLGGSSSHGECFFDVQNKGRLIAQGFWYEGYINSHTNPFIKLTSTSSGDLNINGMFWADVRYGSYPTFSIDGFNGSFSFLGNKFSMYSSTGANWQITNNCQSAKVFNAYNLYGLNSTDNWQNMWQDNSSPAADAAALDNHDGYDNDCLNFTNVYNKTANSKPDTTWIASRLATLRSLYFEKDVPKPDRFTNLRLIRVDASTSQGGTAVRIRASSRGTGIIKSSLNMPHQHNSIINKILMPGQTIQIPLGLTKVNAYDLTGRLILSRIIESDHDALIAKKEIQTLSKTVSVMVKFQ